jgi:hypothetical protein
MESDNHGPEMKPCTSKDKHGSHAVVTRIRLVNMPGWLYRNVISLDDQVVNLGDVLDIGIVHWEVKWFVVAAAVDGC